MTANDLKFLKTASPQELLKLTNGIPWLFCVGIKASLLAGHQSLVRGLDNEWREEQVKWEAAGAVRRPAEDMAWFEERANQLANCDECGDLRYFPHRDHKKGRRVSFTKAGGFVWMELCAECIEDHDLFHNPMELVKRAARWQGRCLAPATVRA